MNTPLAPLSSEDSSDLSDSPMEPDSPSDTGKSPLHTEDRDERKKRMRRINGRVQRVLFGESKGATLAKKIEIEMNEMNSIRGLNLLLDRIDIKKLILTHEAMQEFFHGDYWCGECVKSSTKGRVSAKLSHWKKYYNGVVVKYNNDTVSVKFYDDDEKDVCDVVHWEGRKEGTKYGFFKSEIHAARNRVHILKDGSVVIADSYFVRGFCWEGHKTKYVETLRKLGRINKNLLKYQLLDEKLKLLRKLEDNFEITYTKLIKERINFIDGELKKIERPRTTGQSRSAKAKRRRGLKNRGRRTKTGPPGGYGLVDLRF